MCYLQMWLFTCHFAANFNIFFILRLKCPYCPMEQSPGDAKQIFFWGHKLLYVCDLENLNKRMFHCAVHTKENSCVLYESDAPEIFANIYCRCTDWKSSRCNICYRAFTVILVIISDQDTTPAVIQCRFFCT